MGTGTSFDSISLEDMSTDVRTFLIKVFTGFSSNRFSKEKKRMAHDTKNKSSSCDVSCWFPELVLLCCSVTLSSVLLNVSLVVLVAMRWSMKEFMKSSMLPSLTTSAATMIKGTAIVLMIVSQLSSIPLCAAGDDLKQAGKLPQQDLFILLNQPGL